MGKNTDIELSIVIPTYNSQPYIANAILQICGALTALESAYEIIIVDDNSSDDTLNVCRPLLKEVPWLRVLHLKRNYGQRVATSVGYDRVRGRYVTTFDDDLQYLPETILSLYRTIRQEDVKVISGYYTYPHPHQGYGLLRAVVLHSLNWIFFPAHAKSRYFTSFKVFDRATLEDEGFSNIFYFWELRSRDILPVRVDKRDREAGTSNYSMAGYFRMFSHILFRIILKMALWVALPLIAFLFWAESVGLWALFSVVVLIGTATFLLKRDKYFHRSVDVVEIV